MRNSLRKKYPFIGVGLILAFLLMSLLFNWLFKEQFLIWENHRKMESVCAQLGEWIDKDSGELQRKIEELGFEENVKISVFNSNYEIVAATQPQRELSGSVNRKLVQKLKEMWGILDETGFYFEQGKREDRDYPYLIQAKKMGDSGYVVVRKSIPALQKDMATMDIFYVLSGGVTLAVGSVIIVCLVGRMVRPLIDMNRVTRKIAKLDFGEAVQVKSEDEIGMLAASINSMSDQLRVSMGELQRELEFRKGMLRNLAHELKTPIAVIGGYTEHMPYIAENQPQKLQKYIDVIAKECVRMDQMIQEMLTLCAYEGRDESLQISEFAASEFLEDLKAQAKEELLREIQIVDQTPGKIQGDYQMLKRAVYNYVKNAAFYSPGNSRIRVKVQKDEKGWQFSVYNSGSHVDEKEMNKIWEVFYKSDQARTRERSSCGIGLAIAKEVAIAHGGRTWAENTEDGVLFYLTVPGNEC